MNLYHIDDKASRRLYLPEIISALSRRSGWVWLDGFSGRGENAWQNADDIMRALNDDAGVILLDLYLDDDGSGVNMVTVNALEAALHSQGTNHHPYLQRVELQFFRGGQSTIVSSHVLAAALALQRSVIILSSHGFGAISADSLGVGYYDLPSVGMRPAVALQVIESVADTIMLRILRSPYDVALTNWINWGTRECGQPKFFPASPDSHRNFHDVSDWLNPGKLHHRPATERQVIGEAQRLLKDCNCGTYQLDFPTSLKVLKGVARNRNHLDLTLVEMILSCTLEEGFGVRAGTTPYLNSRVCAVRVAVALSRLRHHLPNDAEPDPETGHQKPSQWRLALVRRVAGTPRLKLEERVAFDSESAALRAKNQLSLAPTERKLVEGRAAAGVATEACFWLRQGAQDWGLVIQGKCLTLEFEFDVLGVR